MARQCCLVCRLYIQAAKHGALICVNQRNAPRGGVRVMVLRDWPWRGLARHTTPLARVQCLCKDQPVHPSKGLNNVY